MARNRKSNGFQPNAPTKGVWILALVIGLLGIIGNFTNIDYVTPEKFWFVTVGFLLLVLATSLKKL